MAKKSNKEVLNYQLQRLHLVSAIIFGFLGLAVWFLMKPTSYPFVVSHATSDELASQSTTVFAPAIHHIIDIDMRWPAAALMVVGLVTAILALTHWRKQYVKQMGNRLSPLTWVSMGGIMPALMFEIIAIFSGGQDILYLKMIAGLVLLSGILGYMAERENMRVRRPQWINFWLVFASGALAWFALATMIVSTSLFGMVRLPWFVYALMVVLTVASLSAVTNLWFELKAKNWAKDFNTVERNYLLINLLAKASFVLIMVLGLKK